jgi:hypothetical protein
MEPRTVARILTLGARDVVLGIGGAWAEDKRPWLLAAAISDLADSS